MAAGNYGIAAGIYAESVGTVRFTNQGSKVGYTLTNSRKSGGFCWMHATTECQACIWKAVAPDSTRTTVQAWSAIFGHWIAVPKSRRKRRSFCSGSLPAHGRDIRVEINLLTCYEYNSTIQVMNGDKRLPWTSSSVILTL
jgi:hypothetical protein